MEPLICTEHTIFFSLTRSLLIPVANNHLRCTCVMCAESANSVFAVDALDIHNQPGTRNGRPATIRWVRYCSTTYTFTRWHNDMNTQTIFWSNLLHGNTNIRAFAEDSAAETFTNTKSYTHTLTGNAYIRATKQQTCSLFHIDYIYIY